MKYTLIAAGVILSFAATVHADDDQPPRTHIDTTVVGDAMPANAAPSTDSTVVDNGHHFVAGDPELVSVTRQLKLSAKQQELVNAAIERADAGAAVLIKREHNLQEMLAATTPENPQYAKLVDEQTGDISRWSDNREGLHQDVLNVLTPAQRTRFEKLTAQNQTAESK